MAKITAPDAGMYGVFSPTFAQLLSQKSGNLGADAINTLALAMGSRGERRGYGDILAKTNEQALRMGEIEGGTEVAKSYLGALPQLFDKGAATSVDVRQPYVTLNNRADGVDAVALNSAQQAAFENTAQGVKALTESGMRPTEGYLEGMVTPPLQETPAELEPYVSFDSETDRIKANADMVSAHKPNSGGSGSGGVQLTITDDGFGDPAYSYRGKDPAAVRAAYEAQNGGPGAAGPAGPGQKPVVGKVARAKATGATVTKTGPKTIRLTFPTGQVRELEVIDGAGNFREKVIK